MILKKSVWLDGGEVRLGKKVYVRSRPDRVGIIVELKSPGNLFGVSLLDRGIGMVKVMYAKTGRVTNWIPWFRTLCDLDAYYQEVNAYSISAAQCMALAEEGLKKYKKKYPHQV